MSDSEISDEGVEQNDEQMGFVVMLSDYPQLFDKGKSPNILKKKETCWGNLTKTFNANYNKNATVKQMMKKFNNMKTKVKEKTDLKKTGNKKIILNEWQSKFYELWNTRGENPVLHQVPGAESAGTSEVKRKTDDDLSVTPKRKIVPPENVDDVDDFQKLSLPVLQRHVLVQQMKTAKAQEQAAIAQEKAAIAQEQYFIAMANQSQDVVFLNTGN